MLYPQAYIKKGHTYSHIPYPECVHQFFCCFLMHNMHLYLNELECVHLGVRIQVYLQFADKKHIIIKVLVDAFRTGNT